jgi:hypothetical protein
VFLNSQIDIGKKKQQWSRKVQYSKFEKIFVDSLIISKLFRFRKDEIHQPCYPDCPKCSSWVEYAVRQNPCRRYVPLINRLIILRHAIMRDSAI